MLGQGIYTFGEASRLTGIPLKRLRRWLAGYDFNDRTGARRRASPVFSAAVHHDGGEETITFLDLLEAMFVDRFLAAGVSFPVLRRAAEQAAKDFSEQHPFCLRRFRTDGRTIFVEVAKDEGDVKLLDIVRRQAVFRVVIDPLLSQIDYDVATGMATAWFPMGKSSPVVVDPTRAFGQPIVRGPGVTTRVLAAAVIRGRETVESAAAWYGVDPDEVQAAIDFEQRDQRAAA